MEAAVFNPDHIRKALNVLKNHLDYSVIAQMTGMPEHDVERHFMMDWYLYIPTSYEVYQMCEKAGIHPITLKPIEKQPEPFVLPEDPKPQPFFMVYAEGQDSPKAKHEKYYHAYTEAKRLAKKLGCNTYILSALTEVAHQITTSNFAEFDREDLPF